MTVGFGIFLIVAGIVVTVLGLIAAPFRLWAEKRRTDYPADRTHYGR